MTPEIEKRIKLVQAGKVPAGYKRTKIGIVPKEWSICSFGSLSSKTGRKKRPTEDFPVYSINNQKGFCSQSEQFENDGYSNTSKDSYTLVEKGDFAYNPARINIGSIGLLKTQEKVVISSLYVCFKLNSSCNKEYFESYFKSHRFNYDVSNYIEGSVRQYLFYDNFAKISVAVPPKREQEKIAEILAAQDRVIELKEKLVAEKKNNKSILLKRLLNDCCFGEQRDNVKIGSVILAQTSWKKQKLGSICEKIGSGSTPKGGRTVYLDRGIPIIRSQNVLNGYLDMSDVAYISDEQHKKMSGTWVRPNDILLNITGASIGRACLVPASVQTANVNQHVCIVRLKEGVNHSYICSLILSDKVQKQIELMSAGGGRQGLNFQQIASFEVPLPSLPEQQAIAKVLSAADEEIALLQKNLEQEKLKKKSLMQLLLTGLVRVSA